MKRYTVDELKVMDIKDIEKYYDKLHKENAVKH